MKYDFDAPVQRRQTYSLKWDVDDGELPMWVADMDFKTCPEVIEAIKEKIDIGALGYSTIPDDWYQAYISWWDRRHGYHLQKDWLAFVTGVVPTISSAVRRLTKPGDNILTLTPVYDIFFHSIENNGRVSLESPLIYQDGSYSVDFIDLENKLKDEKTTMMIFCNPHNPIGKIWTREEMAKIGKLAEKYHVVVLSDEIHCDLTDCGSEYIPYAAVNKTNENNSVTCLSVSKAFNLAGLQSAAVVIQNPDIRRIIIRGINNDEIAEPNIIALEGTLAALNKGENWLDQLRRYLLNNKQTVSTLLKTAIPRLHLVDSQATYLLWIDVSSYTDNAEELRDDIRKKTGLYLSAGNQYRGNGKGFLRMNIACPKSELDDGLNRLKRYFSTVK